MKLTASNIVKAILNLPRDQWFEYINEKTRSQVRVKSAAGPEGPIYVERRNPTKNSGEASTATLSSAMIWRIANAYAPNVPINFDRVLAGSYNTRSLLEALLTHTPEFYWCIPGRIELINSSSEIKRGHKHIVWMPDSPHQNGVLTESKTGSEQAISEIPTQTIIYDSLAITEKSLSSEIDIDVKRRHLQIQIALIEMGFNLALELGLLITTRAFNTEISAPLFFAKAKMGSIRF
jgi:type II restriction enzyme